MDRYLQPVTTNAPEEKIKGRRRPEEEAEAKVKVRGKVKEQKEGRKEKGGRRGR